MKYTLRFIFEYGSPCLWAADKNTADKFGYSIHCDDLPISQTLISKIKDLEKEFQTSLNWENPLDVSPWSLEHRNDFLKRAHIIYDKLTIELGHDFEVIDQINC